MFRLINPLKATARSIPRHAYSTSSKSSGGSGKLVTVGLPLGIATAAAYAYYSDRLGGAIASNAEPAVVAKKVPITSALDPNAFVDFKLKKVEKLTPNTSRFTFELEENQKLGMDVTSCVITKFAKEDGKAVIRPYTPTSDADQTGSFDFVIKHYENGPMSTHIHSLKPGETLSVKGPISKYPLKANQHESVSLIAGGSGITPMIQIISGLLKDKTDKTKINLIFANVTPEDIILKDEIDAYAKAHPDRFKVTYVVDKPVDGWKGPTGYVTAELIKKYNPEIGTGNTKVFVCGPPLMVKSVSGPKGPNFTQGDVGGALKELGLTNEDVFKF
ncbi:NADH-cytochrome b5 reductase [Entomortierella chlamydospora]|uniref:NADH-cytochrome b5 reductase n=1 Tax=Entomortierella chlamydospora TaxID=101097 RepID=A0A9P6SZX7_9FUNG|nr:NADH-cytochrome b5 reductase [Entomortierella chlamydospora]KAG0014250.1 NADH-cytochrome b5 reductase [Entomortierella chlamydospora]